jgi:hypothetical protein
MVEEVFATKLMLGYIMGHMQNPTLLIALLIEAITYLHKRFSLSL